LHKQEDDAFGPRCEVRVFRGELPPGPAAACDLSDNIAASATEPKPQAASLSIRRRVLFDEFRIIA
jgi:hypothetical protein